MIAGICWTPGVIWQAGVTISRGDVQGIPLADMATADFIPKPKIHPPRRQHLAQKLYFKQTIIPILLTLGLICLAIPTLGLLSSQYSPFKALAEIYFLATFWPLGLAFLTFGLLTMFSVKKEIEPPTSPDQSSTM